VKDLIGRAGEWAALQSTVSTWMRKGLKKIRAYNKKSCPDMEAIGTSEMLIIFYQTTQFNF
jgi:hypothetical protein